MPDATFVVYHGQRKETGIIVEQGTLRETTVRGASLHLAAGQVVCFDVVNALPARYRYAMDIKVDTSTPPVPDISLLTAALNGLTGLTKGSNLNLSEPIAMAALLSIRSVEPSEGGHLHITDKNKQWWEDYAGDLTLLSNDIKFATALADTADVPENIKLLQAAPDAQRSGLGYAQTRLLSMPRDTGRFGSDSLRSDVERLYTRHKTQAKSDADKVILEALHLYSRSLVDAADKIKHDYRDAALNYMGCDSARTGKTTFSLFVTARDTAHTPKRDAEPQRAYALVENNTPFVRSLVELTPMVFLASRNDVPRYTLRADNTVQETRSGASATRAGTMLHFNLWELGEAHTWVIGPGLGVGVGGDSKIVSDVLAGVTFGYRDWARVGLAYGVSRFAIGLKNNAQPNATLPAGTKLDDLINTDLVPAVQVIFSLPGVALGKKNDK